MTSKALPKTKRFAYRAVKTTKECQAVLVKKVAGPVVACPGPKMLLQGKATIGGAASRMCHMV